MSQTPATSDSETPTDAGTKRESGGKPPPTFGGLAKRIRSRTTDLLAIAVVLVGGFVVGGHVSQMWDSGETNPQAQNALRQIGDSQPFDGDEPVELDFGNSPWSLQRSIFTGDRKAAGSRLLEICRNAAKSATLPAHPSGEGERKLLAKLASEKPLEEAAGRNLYRVDGPVIMASVTAPVNGEAGNGAAGNRRMICWGLAFPAAEKRWVTYLFRPRSGHSKTSSDGLEIPLPAEAKLILTIRTNDSLTQTFRTAETVDLTKRYFNTWCAKNEWQPVLESATHSTATWRRTIEGGQFRAELHLSPTQAGGASGLLISTKIAE